MPERAADAFERLRAAERLLQQFAGGQNSPDAVEQFLAQHADLRELLEPLLTAATADPDALNPAVEILDGDYQLVRELGRGGMGIVFEARQLSLNRSVAIKLLAPVLCLHPTAVARFQREATLAAKLDDPAVAKVFGFGQCERGHYLAMQLIDGAPLDEILRRLVTHRSDGLPLDASALQGAIERSAPTPSHDPLEPGRSVAEDRSYGDAIARLIAPIARALDLAHRAGVIHRDVKPSNIMVRANGTAVLTDFGLARETGGVGYTQTGEFAGTPAYQSPEQLGTRSQDLGPSTDIFSLGATLYELLTLERPFQGETIAALHESVRRDEPRRPQRLDPRIPRDLESIVLHALEKSVGDRYSTAAAFADDLECYLARRPVRARPLSRLARVRRWCQRNPLATAFAGVLVLATTLVSLLLVTASSRLADFHRLAVGVRADRFSEAVDAAYPAWPETAPKLRSLIAEGKALVATTEELDQLLRDLRSHAIDPAAIELAFMSDVDTSLYTGATAALADLERIRDDVLPDLEARLQWANRVDAQTTRRPEWAAAIEAIRNSPHYVGQTLEPQRGLVPLRTDPESGFFEFWHPRSGIEPRIDSATGRYSITADAGLVMVLLPAGAFLMGCQSEDAHGPNFDLEARNESHEMRPREVRLTSPYFFSKFELTRGQWLRLGASLAIGENDEKDTAENPLRFPVIAETWNDATLWLDRHGLRLPSEAEWESACRAGSHTRWAFGNDETRLGNFANVRDLDLQAQAALAAPPRYLPYAPTHDGFVEQAPVDSLLPNPFGFHLMHGNVNELCSDWFKDPVGPDGVQPPPSGRIVRGGDYLTEPYKTGSGIRSSIGPNGRSRRIGIRPARSLR